MAKRDFRLNISKEMQSIQQKTVEMNKDKKLVWLNPNELLDDEDNEFFYGDFKNDVETLARSIKRDGFNEIIFAYKVGEQYKIRSGHRRKYAAIQAEVTLVPVVLEAAPKTDYDRIIRLLDANNNKREDKPMIMAKTAARYFELIQARRSEDEEYAKEVRGIATKDLVADKMGKSSALVSMYAALMKLIPELQKKADDENYSWSALGLAAVLPENKQRLVNEIIEYEVEQNGAEAIKSAWLKKVIRELKDEQYVTLEDYKCQTVRQQVVDTANQNIAAMFANALPISEPPQTEEVVEEGHKKTPARKREKPTTVDNIRNSAFYLFSCLETAEKLSEEEKSSVQICLRSLRDMITKFIGE